MEYCITINPIPHSQHRTKFDYEWSIEYQLIRNPLVSVNIRSANLVIFKILYYGMNNTTTLVIDMKHMIGRGDLGPSSQKNGIELFGRTERD